MAKWTVEWLTGPTDPPAGSSTWRGQALGLPENGAGSIAGGGARLAAFIVDLILAALLTALFVRPEFADPALMRTFNGWSVATWAALSVAAVSLFGFTPGMAMFGLGVARLDGSASVGMWRALVRAALTFVLVPAAIRNADGRGLHDRATGTVVIRIR